VVCLGYRWSVPTYEPALRGTDVLFEVLEEHLGTFLDLAEAAGRPVPSWVRSELTDYLACGIVRHGFTLLRCLGCRTSRVVAFSCKGRAFCPSCCGRRMNSTAAHLVDRVFPRVPVRQWVLSLPIPLRYRLAWDADLCEAVLASFIGTLEGFYRVHTDQPSGRGGAVTFQQLFGSSMAANLHFHTLRVDGVFAVDADGALVFHPAPPLTTEQVQGVVDEVRRRVVRLLRRRGLLDEADELSQHDEHDPDEDAQRVLLGASVAGRVALGLRAGKRPRALRGPPRPQRPLPPRCAVAEGFNLHADVRLAGPDRPALERLCRYIARPPVSHDRLSRTPEGDVVLTFKRAWDDGTRAHVLTPLEFIARLAAIVPRPRRHLLHLHGVFAPAASLRSRVVPAPPPTQERQPLLPPSVLVPRHSRWIPWSDLLWRVFEVDGRACPTCGRPMTVHAVVQGVWATRRVLASLARPSAAPPLLPGRAPPAATA
jgi:hypothetical protein